MKFQAESRKVEEMRKAMFSCQKINFTENRAVLHIALRNINNKPLILDGQNVIFFLDFIPLYYFFLED